MKKFFYLPLSFAILLSLTSCEKKLSDLEKEVVYEKIPTDLYELNVHSAADALDDYLFESICKYSEEVENKVNRDIKKARGDEEAMALFFGSLAAWAPSKSESLASQYNRYISYANKNRQTLNAIVMGVAEIIAHNPSLLDNFPGKLPLLHQYSDSVNLECFSKVEYIPSSISLSEYETWSAVGFENSDKIKWGETILPYSKSPKLSAGAIAVSVISLLKSISVPKPVYAIYDKENKTWDIGYSTKQAVTVNFIEKGDVLNWEYDEAEYVEAYKKSKYNVLNNK